jgi:hypothetical protein
MPSIVEFKWKENAAFSMATRFCAFCGQPVAPNGRFCSACGAAVGGTAPPPSPAGTPPSYVATGPAAYTPYRPSYPADQGSLIASGGGDRLALSNVFLAAILGLVGVVLSYSELFTTSVTASFTGATTTSTGGSFTLDMTELYVLVALGGAGVVLALIELWLYRQAFRTLARDDSRFSTPASLTLLALVALLVIIVVAIALVGVVYQAIICAGPGNPITSACINAGSVLGLIVIIGVAAIVLLVGYIGLLIGIWRLGTRYGEDMFKVGAILLIIPLLNVVGLILILVATNSARGRLRAGSSPLQFG